MNEDRTHECLIQLTAQAATQHEGMQREVAEDGAHEPMPGDLYVFLETADLPVEWMVVELRGDDSQKVRVVPTDSNPLMGPADKSVPEDDPSGPLSVRSGFGVWLPGSALSHEQRVGRVDRAWVDRHLPLALIDEPTMDPAVATEYLVDPELNDWIESVPAKAQALLSSQSLSPPQDKTQMVPLHARSFMKSVTGSPYGIAASVLLVITVGLGGGLLHQFQRAEDAGQLLHQTRVQLAEARGEVEDAGLIPNDDVVRQLQELEGRHVAERQELRDQIKVLATQLEDAGVEKPLLNLPLVWLSPMETVRGDSRRVNLQGTAGSFLLVLEVQDARFFSTYRVDVEDIATGTITWSGEDLIRSGPAEIVLVLPRNLFPTGEYRLVLNGVSDSGEERLDQYSLQVNREEKNS